MMIHLKTKKTSPFFAKAIIGKILDLGRCVSLISEINIKITIQVSIRTTKVTVLELLILIMVTSLSEMQIIKYLRK
jgi:hypothetical protein